MKPPLFVRELTDEEQQTLREGLRSRSAFTVLRCQALLASAQQLTPRQIQKNLGPSDQTIRNIIHAFHEEGMACLKPKSSRPKSARKLLSEAALTDLTELLHHSPREFGRPTSLWTLRGVAKVCHQRGLTQQEVSVTTISDALRRLGMKWKRAKRWINSPDEGYARKKGHAIA